MCRPSHHSVIPPMVLGMVLLLMVHDAVTEK